MNTDKIAIFTDTGKLHTVKVLDVPRKRLRDKGTPIDNLSNFSNAEEEILWVGAMADVIRHRFFFATANGNVKLTQGKEFVSSVRSIQSTRMQEDDRIVTVQPADEMDFAVLRTREGYFIRFSLEDVSELRKTAVGVRGIHLSEGDKVDGAWLLTNGREFSIGKEGGRMSLNRLKLSKRGGKGVKSRH